jgi:hypothetical protein
MKRKRVGGDEQDALSRKARRLYHWKPGQINRIKRRNNKRERREGKKQIQEEM